jgi:hypothetical protein
MSALISAYFTNTNFLRSQVAHLNAILNFSHLSGWTYNAGHINAEMISKALFPPSPQNLVTGPHILPVPGL